jgi:hypothetical protein
MFFNKRNYFSYFCRLRVEDHRPDRDDRHREDGDHREWRRDAEDGYFETSVEACRGQRPVNNNTSLVLGVKFAPRVHVT